MIYINIFKIFHIHLQEVDGKSLLLLDEEKLNKLLGIKIGPAMKIARQIQKLKSCFAPVMPANSECSLA